MTLLSAQAMRATPEVTPGARDHVLIAAVAALLGLGLVMVFSASVSVEHDRPGGSFYYLLRQLAHIAAGGMLAWLALALPLVWWQRISGLLVVVAMALLGLVLVPGLSGQINGSARWFQLGPLNLQPSEFAKLFVVIYTAAYLTRKREQLQYFSHGILMIGIVVGLVGALLLMEPDFGSMVVLSLTVGGMLFLAGVRFRYFVLCATIGIGAMVGLVVMAPYRMQRVSAFLNPWSDPFDSGFQLTQALIAFGRGEWFGVGLGASVQKLFYLPAANTDFLLAVVGEELGLLGVVAVLALVATLMWRAFAISRRAEVIDLVFAARLAQGLGLLLGLQAMVNVGVNLGALPTKGLTLPLMSYGGSSMLASLMAVGLLLAADRATRPRPGERR